MKKVILALLSAALAGLLTAVIWAQVPSLVATKLGADDEVLLVFFLGGPPVGVLAVGVLLGVIWGDYRCAACF